MRLLSLLLLWAFIVSGLKGGSDAEARGQAVGEGTVLVLGSGGLVGRYMMEWLRERGYTVAEVRNRNHVDLRVPGALDRFNASDVRYCIFLACEVGGSKFIESSSQDVQIGIIESNLRIYQSVFPWLIERNVSFAFSSSYLQSTHNGYGVVKRLGEAWIHNLHGLGKVLRLWNVYGAEAVGLKSHVLSDWAQGCASNGEARSLTNGMEERQFVHARDTAAALGITMERHDEMDIVSDVSSGEWVTMKQAGSILAAASDDTCDVTFSDARAGARERLDSQLNGTLHRYWQPEVSLEDGCRELLGFYARMQHACAANGSCDAA